MSIYGKGEEGKRREGGRGVVFPLRKIEKEKKRFIATDRIYYGGNGDAPLCIFQQVAPSFPRFHFFLAPGPPSSCCEFIVSYRHIINRIASYISRS